MARAAISKMNQCLGKSLYVHVLGTLLRGNRCLPVFIWLNIQLGLPLRGTLGVIFAVGDGSLLEWEISIYMSVMWVTDFALFDTLRLSR